MVKITERGWAGHFCCASRCDFRRNTLIESENDSIVVSTIGSMRPLYGEKKMEPVGGTTIYYETQAFRTTHAGPYVEANVSDEQPFESEWQISAASCDDLPCGVDNKANEMHEAVVDELVESIQLNTDKNLYEAAVALAKQFHTEYERLAPQFGYETRADTREFDTDSANGKLMIAVCEKILQEKKNQNTKKFLSEWHNFETLLDAQKFPGKLLSRIEIEHYGKLGWITYLSLGRIHPKPCQCDECCKVWRGQGDTVTEAIMRAIRTMRDEKMLDGTWIVKNKPNVPVPAGPHFTSGANP